MALTEPKLLSGFQGPPPTGTAHALRASPTALCKLLAPLLREACTELPAPLALLTWAPRRPLLLLPSLPNSYHEALTHQLKSRILDKAAFQETCPDALSPACNDSDLASCCLLVATSLLIPRLGCEAPGDSVSHWLPQHLTCPPRTVDAHERCVGILFSNHH